MACTPYLGTRGREFKVHVRPAYGVIRTEYLGTPYTKSPIAHTHSNYVRVHDPVLRTAVDS